MPDDNVTSEAVKLERLAKDALNSETGQRPFMEELHELRATPAFFERVADQMQRDNGKDPALPLLQILRRNDNTISEIVFSPGPLDHSPLPRGRRIEYQFPIYKK